MKAQLSQTASLLSGCLKFITTGQLRRVAAIATLSSAAVLAAEASAPLQEIWRHSTDFDNFTLGNIQGQNGWSADWSKMGGAVIEANHTSNGKSTARNGANSLHIRGSYTESGSTIQTHYAWAAYKIDLPQNAPDATKLSVSYWVRGDGPTEASRRNAFFSLGNGANAYGSVTAGQMAAIGPQPAWQFPTAFNGSTSENAGSISFVPSPVTFENNQWYFIQAEFDLVDNTYSYWIRNENATEAILGGANLKLNMHLANAPLWIRFGNPTDNTDSVYFDDIQVVAYGQIPEAGTWTLIAGLVAALAVLLMRRSRV